LSGTADGGDDAGVPDLAPPPDLRRFLDLLGLPDGLVAGGLGWPCLVATDCTGGLCIDGFCCDQLCDPLDPQNQCKACNVPGWEGRCTFAIAGSDPRGQCAQQAPSSCGTDGTCDGVGGCRLWAANTACAPGSCAAGAVTYAAACDGRGTCQPAQAPISCAPYQCADSVHCSTGCAGATGCAGGVTCQPDGTCGKRALGQPCTTTTDCASNNCEQGVCCATACRANCFSCALPGSFGTCAAAPPGTDPLDQCPQDSRATCGHDGACDGQGACRRWVAGTPCAAPGCASSTQVVSARSCDGAGVCQPGTVTPCGGTFTCQPGGFCG
jgi:hypothetical protein